MNNLKIKSLRGMNDYLPDDIYIYQYIENIIKNIMNSYSFKEIRFPIIENSDLFNKLINYNNIISSKEMYSFTDRGKRKLVLRPEGTLCCSRYYIKNNLFLKKNFNKLWYIGPMFRYERPQKGRFRQFHQFGIEIFNSKSFSSNLELFFIINRLWKILNINKFLYLEINTIGSINDRKKYIIYVIKNFKKDILNNFGSIKKFNLFKLLDNKNKKINKIFKNFPKIINFVNKKSLLYFKKLCNILNLFGISYKINNNLVRGLDYYNDLVFEWKSNFLKKNYTICAGGRYDFLINKLYNISIPAIGCALGLERLFIFLNDCKKINNINKNYIDIYILSSYNKKSKILGLSILEKILNSKLNIYKIYNDYIWKGKVKKLILRVLNINVKILIIIDKNEINGNYITVKDLYLNIQRKTNINNIIKILYKILLFKENF